MLIRGPCTKDLFVDQLNAQLPQFFSWRPDPLTLALDALQQNWSNERNYAFPPFCLIMRSLAKLREQGGELVLVIPVWPMQVWYPTLLDLSVSLPVLLPTSQSLARPSGAGVSPDCEPIVVPRHVACIKQSLQSEGICADTSKLILVAWRPGTNAVYNSAWEKWHSWCLSWGSDSFCPTLADITSFLSDCFNQGLLYRTLNTYRSALSGVLLPIDGFPVGQHPLVVRLLKGVQNLQPALPRYQYSWDVDKVLNYLRSLRKNEDLPLKSLTQKLAVLLALTAPKCALEPRLLDLPFMRILPEGAEFNYQV